jgi:hypothetical protein
MKTASNCENAGCNEWEKDNCKPETCKNYKQEPMKTKEEIIRSHLACTCHEMYKTRRKADPSCFLCEYKSEIELMMEEYKQQEPKESKPKRYKCLLCGRRNFTQKQAHICGTNYRRRGLKWEEI